MKQYFLPTILSVLMLASCGDSKKDSKAAINDKKVQLEKLKIEKEKNNQEIAKLQAELLKLDPNSNPSKVKLVATVLIVKQNFNHYIELQGKVDADDISYISPRGMGGQVKVVYVKQGDLVKKGQLLLKLEDAI
ncbi:MAG: biotin/lipoyl-binding protein, partial [Ferruginibacter sp.]